MSQKFSIITPTYNRSHLIGKGIESVINQSYDNWELIVIDDGSTDNTEEIVKSFDDERLKYHWQENQERSIARNNGIDKATGAWICFLDSDDYYQIDYLDNLNKYINKSKIIRSVMNSVTTEGKEISRTSLYENEMSQQYYAILTHNTLMQFCFHKSIFHENRFLNISNWEDKEFLVRVLNTHKFLDTNFLGSSIVEHPERSVKHFYKDTEKVKEVLPVIKTSLQNAKNITPKQKTFLYNRYVYSLVHLCCTSGPYNFISYLSNINELNTRNIIRGFYYTTRYRILNGNK